VIDGADQFVRRRGQKCIRLDVHVGFVDSLYTAAPADHPVPNRRCGAAPLLSIPCPPIRTLGLALDPVTHVHLGDTYEIVYAPNLDVLASARVQNIPRSLAAVANPTGDLHFAEIEARLVASHFDKSARATLERVQATSSTVLAALRGKAYWHFACHGTFDWGDPRGSALVMFANESLSVGQLLDADGLGRPRLVVLSACESGLYRTASTPDEFVGLPGTFIALGATGVLASLWQVDDRATALLMAKFYESHLKDGLSPPTALRIAQGWLRNATTRQLITYVKAVFSTGQISKAFAEKFQTAMVHGRYDHPRFAQIERFVQTESASASQSKFLSFLGLKSRRDERPFVHPYYWGGFIYTGL